VIEDEKKVCPSFPVETVWLLVLREEQVFERVADLFGEYTFFEEESREPVQDILQREQEERRG
jgi:hypothetical protein